MVFLVLLLTVFYLGLPQIVLESYTISTKKSKFEFFQNFSSRGKTHSHYFNLLSRKCFSNCCGLNSFWKSDVNRFMHTLMHACMHPSTKNTVFIFWVYQAFSCLIGNMLLSECFSVREGFILCLYVLKSLLKKYETFQTRSFVYTVISVRYKEILNAVRFQECIYRNQNSNSC